MFGGAGTQERHTTLGLLEIANYRIRGHATKPGIREAHVKIMDEA